MGRVVLKTPERVLKLRYGIDVEGILENMADYFNYGKSEDLLAEVKGSDGWGE